MKEMPKLEVDYSKGQEEPNATVVTPLALALSLAGKVMRNRPEHKGAARKMEKRICPCGHSKPPFRELCFRCKPPWSQVAVNDPELCFRCKKNPRDKARLRYCKECRDNSSKDNGYKMIRVKIKTEETGEP